MKKVILLFIIPTVAAGIVVMALHTVVGLHQAQNMDQLSGQDQYNFIFALLGFLFGFLPCLIYGLALCWMADNAPEFTPANDQERELPEIDQAQPVIYFPSHNCVVRVKYYKNTFVSKVRL